MLVLKKQLSYHVWLRPIILSYSTNSLAVYFYHSSYNNFLENIILILLCCFHATLHIIHPIQMLILRTTMSAKSNCSNLFPSTNSYFPFTFQKGLNLTIAIFRLEGFRTHWNFANVRIFLKKAGWSPCSRPQRQYSAILFPGPWNIAVFSRDSSAKIPHSNRW